MEWTVLYVIINEFCQRVQHDELKAQKRKKRKQA